jgi:hypothetical protein
VAPQNQTLQEALNKVRIRNRGDFLIFQAVGIDNPSRWVDIYGYILAFHSLTMAPTSLKAELQVWASTGNNADFEVETIRLVSTDGREVLAKQQGVGWCSTSDPEGKKKAPLDKKGKLLNEGQCSATINFTFPRGFVPDFVEYKDQYGQGRKYIGR